MLAQQLEKIRAVAQQKKAELESAIEAERRSLEGLILFREKMTKSANYFDADDMRMINEEVNEHEARLKTLTKSLEKSAASHAAHAALFSEMASTLCERSAILEGESDVLAQHPRLLERLAKKQLGLEALLQDKVRELTESTAAAATAAHQTH